MKNEIICATRSAWYAVTEPVVLNIRRAAWRQWNWSSGDPLISVYVPTFNRCELLMTRALPSILGQTYQNMEVIVAAHGCTDATEQLVREIEDRRVNLIRVPRLRSYPPTAEHHWLAGPVHPANAALAACRGAWIARIDDDDTWEPDHLEWLLRFAQAGGYELVSSAYETVKDGNRYTVHHDGGTPRIGGVQTWMYRHYLGFMKFNPDCWRKTWNRVNDTDLADRFRKAGVRIGHLDYVTAKVLPRPGETEVGSKAYRADAAATERRMAFQ